MKGDSRSLFYKNEQKRIRSILDPLFETVGDTVYMSLKSPAELDAMKDRTMSILNNHHYMSPDNTATERRYRGIQEKMLINGRHKER